MRKTLIAITLGLTALAAAACNNGGTTSSASPSMAPVESTMPSDTLASPSDMLASPSDMLASPAAESPAAS